jgi:hypothetical protein
MRAAEASRDVDQLEGRHVHDTEMMERKRVHRRKLKARGAPRQPFPHGLAIW